MARKVVQICDLHAGDVGADDAVVIQLGGERYRLDLCSDHLSQVRRTLGPLLAAARTARAHIGSRQVAGSRRSRAADRTALREWARANGYDVHDRGRVPREIVEAYAARSAAKPAKHEKSEKSAAKARRRSS